ncbi:SPARC-related modular calcium-binding protein 2 [Tupaia chinensis]|uniref:SPARC-related modular calcium-binding protein 2 n=1 Tax=Tupaia chinensis TaxID=246437 RepID=L9L2U5_TUPCH|nr:SPARC-related modular calcium-binding protein 2 [Tupaia chinensis]
MPEPGTRQVLSGKTVVLQAACYAPINCAGVKAYVSRCVAERKYTQEQARKELQQVFIPECADDGTYSQVQCHSYTGYCWCVTPNGRPISGTAVAHKTPRCPGQHLNGKVSQVGEIRVWTVESSSEWHWAMSPCLERPPGVRLMKSYPNEKARERQLSTLRATPAKDTEALLTTACVADSSRVWRALRTQRLVAFPEEAAVPERTCRNIASRYPTLWTEQVKSRQNRTSKSSVVGLMCFLQWNFQAESTSAHPGLCVHTGLSDAELGFARALGSVFGPFVPFGTEMAVSLLLSAQDSGQKQLVPTKD